MKLRLLVCLVEAVAFLLVVYFEPTRGVRGWLHGEAFFDGRPTSYWRSLIDRDLSVEFPTLEVLDPADAPVPASPTLWRRFAEWIGGTDPHELPTRRLLRDAEARLVLEPLSTDQDPGVAAFAADGLKQINKPDFSVPIPLPSGNFMLLDRYWLLIAVHSRNRHTRVYSRVNPESLPLQ